MKSLFRFIFIWLTVALLSVALLFNVASANKFKPTKTNLDSIASKQCCLGWREWAKLPDLFKERLMVKVDSGAKTSSLHAENLVYFEKENEEWVKFDVFPKRSSKKTKYSLEAKIIETKNIRSSNGKMSIRPVIKTPISIGGIEWNIEITLVDRSMMGYRMLLGRTAFDKKFLIDSGKSFIFSEKIKKESNATPSEQEISFLSKILNLIKINDESVAGNTLKSFLILLIIFVIRIYSNLLLNKKEFRNDLDKIRTKTLIKRILLVVGFILLLLIWINEFRAISIYLMAMSVAVVLTMREAIKSLHGGLHLLSSRPFKVGDIIQIKNHTGEVIQTDFMSTKILENSSSGNTNLITLPNSLFLSSPIINKSSTGLVKKNDNSLSLTYTFKEDKNWKKREDIFKAAISNLGENTEPENGPEFRYTFLAPDKIRLNINFNSSHKNADQIKSRVIRDFLERYYID